MVLYTRNRFENLLHLLYQKRIINSDLILKFPVRILSKKIKVKKKKNLLYNNTTNLHSKLYTFSISFRKMIMCTPTTGIVKRKILFSLK